METSDSDMESAVSFYDRVPNRFTRTSIAPHETMDFSLGSMPLEYPYPPSPSCPSRVSTTSLSSFPLRFRNTKTISLIDPSIGRRREKRKFFGTNRFPLQKRDDFREASKSRLTIPVKGVYLRSSIYYA